jgi:hypothetical protein
VRAAKVMEPELGQECARSDSLVVLPGLRGFASEKRKAPPVIEGENVEIMPLAYPGGRVTGAPNRD